MRAALPLLLLLVAGCTSFPADTRVLGTWDVAALAPGQNATFPFEAGGAGYVVVGFRVGADDRVLLGLEAPNGTRYAARAGEPAVPCAVARPAPGTWHLRVEADGWDGNLSAGRFTVRAGDILPAIIGCTNAPWPGANQTFTLAMANATLEPGGSTQLDAVLRADAARIVGEIRGDDAANVTVELHGPNGTGRQVLTPAAGAWNLTARAPENATRALNVTLAIRVTAR